MKFHLDVGFDAMLFNAYTEVFPRQEAAPKAVDSARDYTRMPNRGQVTDLGESKLRTLRPTQESVVVAECFVELSNC